MQASGATGAPPQPAPPQDSTPPTTMLPVPTFNPNPMVQIVRPTGGVLKRPLEQVTCFKVSTHSYFNFILIVFFSVETRAIMPTWYVCIHTYENYFMLKFSGCSALIHIEAFCWLHNLILLNFKLMKKRTIHSQYNPLRQ